MKSTPPPQNTRVLVTGGCGFLGRQVVLQLLDEGATVAVVSRAPKPLEIDERFKDKISYHAADISSEPQIQDIFTQIKPCAVIHTAALLLGHEAIELRRCNVNGTQILLRYAKECPETKAFVYTSTDSATVPTQEPLTEENAQLYNESHFSNQYGLTKAIADKMVTDANTGGSGLATAVLRVPVLYGEYDHPMVRRMMESIRKKEHKIQVGRNIKIFEFLYVKKAAEAHILAFRALLDPSTVSSIAGNAFFISDEKPQPFFTFMRRCYAVAGHPVADKEVTVLPLSMMKTMASVMEWAFWIFTFGTKEPSMRREDIDYLDRGSCWCLDKAKEKLGYEPIADQDEAIKRTMEWAAASL